MFIVEEDADLLFYVVRAVTGKLLLLSKDAEMPLEELGHRKYLFG